MENTVTNHKHYKSAYIAHYNTSFSPEKRAENECNYFDEVIKELQEIGADEKAITKFESLFLASLNAKSKCISSMIAGPAKFPFHRAEKAREREIARTKDMFNFIEKVKKAINKVNNPSTNIRADDKNAIDKLKEKLVKLEKNHEYMKACNKIINDKKENKLERLVAIFGSEEIASNLLSEGSFNFKRFYLTNNNAQIKSIRDRIESLERLAKFETKEIEIEGVKIVQNTELCRIQFFFNGKPSSNIIQLMKSKGFKWSPSNNCWQRLLNDNALFAVKHYIIPKLKELLK